MRMDDTPAKRVYKRSVLVGSLGKVNHLAFSSSFSVLHLDIA